MSSSEDSKQPFSDAAASLESGQVIGEFRIESRLGAGAMGVVYAAHQIRMDRRVALKVLAAHLTANPQFVQRFRREAQMSVRLDHPNVVRGITVGEDAGLHYFAMEFVEGENLSQRLAREGRLAVPMAIRFALDVARALVHAEKRGMVHRDIKPANVMISVDGVVKLADLGLAKVISEASDITTAGVFMGSPGYMAPEQFEDTREVDSRADVYSLGATLYHLVSGRPPFRGAAGECFTMKVRGEWVRAGDLVPGLPAEIDRIISRAMEPNPRDRYPSAGALVADLELFMSTVDDVESESQATLATATGAGLGDSGRHGVASAPGSAKRSRLLVLVGFAAAAVGVGIAASTLYISPPKPAASSAVMISPVLARILQRAYGEIALGEVEAARGILRKARERFPDSRAIAAPLEDLESGTLLLFQYQTPEETLPLSPINSNLNPTLTAADNYRFAFVASRPCYIYAFHLDERPSVAMIFPNQIYSSLIGPVEPGMVHWLPEESGASGSWFHLDDFTGIERVLFTGLTRPLRDPRDVGERIRADADHVTAEIARSPENFVARGGGPVESCFAGGTPVREFRFRHG